MSSLKLVMLALIPMSAAIWSISAWYQWSPQVSQLKVPLGPGVGAADPAGVAPAARLGATVAGAAVVPDAPQAARNAPSPAVAPTAEASLRNSRRPIFEFRSAIPCSS